mmetsp:Transcript_102557/g.285769  ORF Transcript_102557/g.285769 Transcript_102557/m.285769 type:complete len:220 (+) Transcript_102557:1300-1959(+)
MHSTLSGPSNTVMSTISMGFTCSGRPSRGSSCALHGPGPLCSLAHFSRAHTASELSGPVTMLPAGSTLRFRCRCFLHSGLVACPLQALTLAVFLAIRARSSWCAGTSWVPWPTHSSASMRTRLHPGVSRGFGVPRRWGGSERQCAPGTGCCPTGTPPLPPFTSRVCQWCGHSGGSLTTTPGRAPFQSPRRRASWLEKPCSSEVSISHLRSSPTFLSTCL